MRPSWRHINESGFAERYRIVTFGLPRGPWRTTRELAMQDAIYLDLASYDRSRREHFPRAITYLKPTLRQAATPSSQLDKFKAAARELECDDDEGRSDERVKKLVKQKPVEKPTS